MSRQLVLPDTDTARSQQIAVAMALSVLVLGLTLTIFGVWWAQNNLRAEAKSRFDRLVERVQAGVQARLNAPLPGLRGAAGVYAASVSVERDEFRAYVQSSRLTTELPGVRGFGFMERVRRVDLEPFIAATRADGDPGFSVKPVAPGSTQPDVQYIVKYSEPKRDQLAAVGMDAGADPVWREAIERAIRTGEPALSRKVSLGPGLASGAGWLYLLPIYRAGRQSGDARAAASCPARPDFCTHGGQRCDAGRCQRHSGTDRL